MKWLRNQWDRVAAWVAIAGGGLALLLGWLGLSRTAFPAEQIPYIISGGLLGIFLLGIGGTLWLSADLRDEWRKLDRIEETLRGGIPAASPSGFPEPGDGSAPAREPSRAGRGRG